MERLQMTLHSFRTSFLAKSVEFSEFLGSRSVDEMLRLSLGATRGQLSVPGTYSKLISMPYRM